jgi:hypothetical protein
MSDDDRDGDQFRTAASGRGRYRRCGTAVMRVSNGYRDIPPAVARGRGLTRVTTATPSCQPKRVKHKRPSPPAQVVRGRGVVATR